MASKPSFKFGDKEYVVIDRSTSYSIHRIKPNKLIESGASSEYTATFIANHVVKVTISSPSWKDKMELGFAKALMQFLVNTENMDALPERFEEWELGIIAYVPVPMDPAKAIDPEQVRAEFDKEMNKP